MRALLLLTALLLAPSAYAAPVPDPCPDQRACASYGSWIEGDCVTLGTPCDCDAPQGTQETTFNSVGVSSRQLVPGVDHWTGAYARCDDWSYHDAYGRDSRIRVYSYFRDADGNYYGAEFLWIDHVFYGGQGSTEVHVCKMRVEVYVGQDEISEDPGCPVGPPPTVAHPVFP